VAVRGNKALKVMGCPRDSSCASQGPAWLTRLTPWPPLQRRWRQQPGLSVLGGLCAMLPPAAMHASSSRRRSGMQKTPRACCPVAVGVPGEGALLLLFWRTSRRGQLLLPGASGWGGRQETAAAGAAAQDNGERHRRPFTAKEAAAMARRTSAGVAAGAAGARARRSGA
jgi:hypothetical protein